jgi:2-oxoglutarate dehydrogenase E2 component (dihydrolipoamide succinyltransferase)
MPQLGETVTEGTITKWFKSVGDQVARDEPLFEVSTDKVDSEVPSPVEGVVTAILVEEGDTVDVGVRLAVISEGTSPDGTSPDGDGPASVDPVQAAPATAAVPDPGRPAEPIVPVPPVPSNAQPVEAAVPVPESTASNRGPDLSPARADWTPGSTPVNGAADGLVLSPVVRKLLSEHRIDPSTVSGSGLGGRITRGDVEAAIADGGSGTSVGPAAVPSFPDSPSPRPPDPAAARAPAGAAAPVATRPAEGPGEGRAGSPPDARDEVIPFTNIRRRTAEHMVRSKATSAHTLMVKEIDYERVEQVRRAHGARFRAEEGFNLSYLPFAARASVDALEEYPNLNASIGDDALIVHHDVNLGIAVDLDNQGLIVPVVHNAEELNLRGMARRIRDLADRARNKRLSLDDISGGTFSITNAGPFGTLITGAIINQPQVAILSTDGVARKPVVVELPDGTESIAIHSVGLVAMTFDHRAVDGAYVARDLARLAQILNERDWAGEL